MPITINGSLSIDLTRIEARLSRVTDRDGIKQVLDEIGMLIAAEAHDEVKNPKKDIISTGKLLSKINYRISETQNKISLTVSPFGIKYALIQERGARRTPQSRQAMFAKLRETGRLGAKVGKMSPSRHFARPFMEPAFNRHAFKTISLLRELMRKGT
jgi:hypothetical protein